MHTLERTHITFRPETLTSTSPEVSIHLLRDALANEYEALHPKLHHNHCFRLAGLFLSAVDPNLLGKTRTFAMFLKSEKYGRDPDRENEIFSQVRTEMIQERLAGEFKVPPNISETEYRDLLSCLPNAVGKANLRHAQQLSELELASKDWKKQLEEKGLGELEGKAQELRLKGVAQFCTWLLFTDYWIGLSIDQQRQLSVAVWPEIYHIFFLNLAGHPLKQLHRVIRYFSLDGIPVDLETAARAQNVTKTTFTSSIELVKTQIRSSALGIKQRLESTIEYERRKLAQAQGEK